MGSFAAKAQTLAVASLFTGTRLTRGDPQRLAAERLAVGDLASAGALSPEIRISILQAYQAAFTTLCWWLAAITLVCAIAIAVLLAKRPGITSNVAQQGATGLAGEPSE